MTRRITPSRILAAVLIALAVAVTACARPLPEPSGATPVPTLPPEATETMGLIVMGGPFPYRQDGVTFEKREGILPDAAEGYYHEYTVETPGSPDRGARRIVVGNQGEAYWTDDHYGSFSRIAP